MQILQFFFTGRLAKTHEHEQPSRHIIYTNQLQRPNLPCVSWSKNKQINQKRRQSEISLGRQTDESLHSSPPKILGKTRNKQGTIYCLIQIQYTTTVIMIIERFVETNQQTNVSNYVECGWLWQYLGLRSVASLNVWRTPCQSNSQT